MTSPAGNSLFKPQTHSPRRLREWTVSILLVLTVWIVSHAFTLGWDLPSLLEHAPDAMSAFPSLSASDKMMGDAYKYPPLQYMILGLFAPPVDQTKLSPEADLALCASRILLNRSVCAVMGLFCALLILLLGADILGMKPILSAAAASVFLILPIPLFYSHASNMDIPYTMWLLGAVYAAAAAETRPGIDAKHSDLLHLLAGILLGFAFCTKDQVYAVCVLPALFFIWLKWRKTHSIQISIRPLFLWGIPFAAVVYVIYTAAGGLPVAKAHFTWITGAGREDFYAVGTGLSDRLYLLFRSLAGCFAAWDAPLLALAAALAGTAAAERTPMRKFLKENKILLRMTGLALISLCLFLLQATRTWYPRFFLPLLPFAALLTVRLFETLIQSTPRMKRAAIAATALFLPFQTVQSAGILSQLNRTPARMLKEYVRTGRANGETFATTGVQPGVQYLYAPDGRQRTMESMRSWTLPKIDFTPDYLPDISPAPIFLRMTGAAFLILDAPMQNDPGTAALLESGAYTRGRDFLRTVRTFSFFTLPVQEFTVLQRNPQAALPDCSEFAALPFAKQLVFVQALCQYTFLAEPAPEESLAALGALLRPFDRTALETVMTTPDGIEFLRAAYRAAGREEEAARVPRLRESASSAAE